MARELIAHKTDESEQLLADHLKSVAEGAAEFASSFNNADWAYCAGLLHDLGKADPDWQKYIRGEKSRLVNHSEAGAQYAYHQWPNFLKDPCAQIIPYLIAGHHAGLPDYHEGSGNSLKSIVKEDSSSKLIDHADLKGILEPVSRPTSYPFGKNDLKKDSPQKLAEHFHLWIRMLYSCLVDADFLDTERFMDPEQSALRGQFASLEELKQIFDAYMTQKMEKAAPTKLNQIRALILGACKEKAKLSPGFYSLNVPTGGGKTLSSMAFALEHALAHQKKRIIMAIPYTSIIEQTAKVYKYGTDQEDEIAAGAKLFGEENVLEHHCNFNFEKADREDRTIERQKLATENWDAPIIVTTNVQLFESLFNAHSSSCRKLHNLVDSVIILDEAQMLPPEYLKSILSVLRGLVQCFGVTVVLCTATQPAFEGKIGSDRAAFEGIPQNQITPIIDHPEDLAEQLKRVELNLDDAREKLPDWQAVVDRICQFDQVLCIVQTRKDCRDLHRLMPEGTIHLSALMCAEERSEVIAEIKDKLRRGEGVRVISTQLVECGVDIDFPVVFRAIAGMDSIAQSAGRCNREGKLERGMVYLFRPPTETPSGLLRKAADTTKELISLHQGDLKLEPAIYKEYFIKYFKSLNDFDRCEFQKLMQGGRLDFQFRTLSDQYHLIDNDFQGTVYVRYCSPRTGKDNVNLLCALREANVDKQLFRKLGRYSVNLPLKDIQELKQEGRIEEPMEGIFMQALDDEQLYQAGLGLDVNSTPTYSTYIF